MIKWDVTKDELIIIEKIAKRALELELNDDSQCVMMDIQAVHCNDVKLDLQKLLDADNFNFAHDVCGIRRHIDTSTGKLTKCFLPRCTKAD